MCDMGKCSECCINGDLVDVTSENMAKYGLCFTPEEELLEVSNEIKSLKQGGPCGS